MRRSSAPLSILLAAAGVSCSVLSAPAARSHPALQAADPPAASAPVKALIDQGDRAYNARRFEDAVRIYRQAADQARAAGDLVGEGAAWNNLGAALASTGERKQATEAYQKSLAARQASKDARGAAQTLNNLGNIHAQLGELGPALDYYRQSLKIKQEVGDKVGQANTHVNIGNVHKLAGSQKEARDAYEQAANVYRALNDRAGQGTVLNNLGNLFAETGNPGEALKYYEDSLKLRREAKDTAGEAVTLANLGAVYATSNLGEAVRRYTEALAILEAGSDRRAAAAVRHNLASLYASAGQPEKARTEFEKAAQAYRAASDPAGEGIALQGLGALALRQGQNEEARKHFDRALAALKSVGDRRGQCAVLQGLASIDASSGQTEQALERYESAAKLARETLDAPALAGILSGVGSLYAANGQGQKALDAFNESYRLRAERGDRNGAARTLTSIGLVYEASGQFPDAEKSYQEATRLSERTRTELTGLSLETQAAYLAANLAAYHGLVRCQVRQDRTAEAFASAQRVKARLLNDLMSGGNVELKGRLSENDLIKERTLRARVDSLNTAMIAEGVRNEPGSKKRFEAYRTELQEAERELSAFLDGVYSRQPDLALRRGEKTATLAEIAASLPADTVLLEYVVLPRPAGSASAATASDTLVFVVRNEGGKPSCTVHSLKASTERLSGQAEAFRKACADSKQSWKEEAKGLFATLVGPASANLSGAKRLVICPDGPLWDIPFGALLDDAGESLLARYEIAMGFSGTSVRSALASAPARRGKGGTFVLANPEFGGPERFAGPSRPILAPDRVIYAADRPIGSPDRILSAADRVLASPDRVLASPDRIIASPDRVIGSPDRVIGSPDRVIGSPDRAIIAPDRDSPIQSNGRLVPLPGTQREADALKKSLGDVRVASGMDAQEATVKAEAARNRVLHFATHGFFNDGSPLSSCLVLAKPRDAGEDGFLTAREIFALDLSGVEMTVLSACNTGRGEKRRGEGVIGLTWALFAAGCPTQVLSQWAVNDTSTAMLMERFYQRISAGEAKSSALRDAALSLSHDAETSHPYYWAPFVLYGDWR